MTEQSKSSGSPFLRAVGWILRFLVRLIFVLVVGTLIGLGLFYGVPWAYRQLVWPVQENATRIAILEDQVAKNSESIFDNHRALQGRMVALETEIAELQENAVDQAGDQEALAEESQQLAQRITTLEEDLVMQLETQQQGIEAVRSDLADRTSDLDEKIAGVQEQLEEAQQELGQGIEMSKGELDDLEEQLEGALARLSLLQTAQDLLKVRLLLVEENPGAARDTLELALTHLNQAAERLPSQAETFDDLRDRLITLDDLIVQRSFRTRPSLEALWADVMGLVAPLEAQSTVTATQATSPLPTPTPSP